MLNLIKSLANSLLIISFLTLCSSVVYSQHNAKIHGFVKDDLKQPLELVHIKPKTYNALSVSDSTGYFELYLPTNRAYDLIFSHTAFEVKVVHLILTDTAPIDLEVKLKIKVYDTDVFEVYDTRRTEQMTKINPNVVEFVPGPNRDIINSLIASQPGVSVASELSSSYSVRGGNFDENLIYVNDIEVYRPFLVRSGEQEGLSFPNPSMVSSISFSAGGFESKYGDKMSSVLDIKYKKPQKFGGSFMGSLLGGDLHIEGASPSQRFTHVSGIRHKSNQYVLNSLPTQGNYKPSFTDFQTFLTYDVTSEIEINFLGHFSQNNYHFVPETRETDFGTINEALRLKIFFEGQELDAFQTFTGAFSTNYQVSKNLLLKFIGSAYQTYEEETFDIIGYYRLGELERDLGSEDLGEVVLERGVGSFLDHARNSLEATVYNASHKGFYNWSNNYLQWGFDFRSEDIKDRLREWNMVDSAGYSIPQYPQNQIILKDFLQTEIGIYSRRYSSYVQNTWNWETSLNSTISLTAGIRGNYWDLNQQFIYSPRFNLAYVPKWNKTITDSLTGETSLIKRDIVFRASGGVYSQPAFYRELRNYDGKINRDLKAQQSIHAVVGFDYIFQFWDRPFKFVTEAYYKHLTNLVPYEIDNVRIRYSAQNNSEGYTAGIDLKLNGEFVKGIESWGSISIMKTQENLLDDYYYDYYNPSGEKIIPGYTNDTRVSDSIRNTPGYIPRPTDRRVNFALFFQDEMPKWPSYKVHLNLLYGTGLPFGPPTHERYKDVLRMSDYRRVDIGFSKQLIGANTKFKREKSIFRGFKDLWINLEVFNLLGINNTISYLWVKDISDRPYAVPNYLTSRRLNLKIYGKF